MSEFDKEAEREKLREKYEQDKEKRQHTQRMSDLLLKGATMTNQHCDQCGDPIFRHEGQEFCPSCGTGQAEAGAASDDGAGGAEVADADADAGDVDRTPDPQQRSAPAQQSTPTQQPNATQQSTPTQQPSATQQPNVPSEPAEAPADLQAARESLARTVTKFARAAEATDDPRRARDHLEAAREAAEAIAALE